MQPELCLGRISLLSTQKSWFSVLSNASGGILFRSSACHGARWGFSSAQPGACGTTQRRFCKPNGQLKPHGHEQHHLVEAYASRGRLFGMGRGCGGPCVQAGSITQVSVTPTFSLGRCRVLPPVVHASGRVGELQDLFFSFLWEKAPSVQGKELAQELCATKQRCPSLPPPKVLWRPENWFGSGMQHLDQRAKSLSTAIPLVIN